MAGEADGGGGCGREIEKSLKQKEEVVAAGLFESTKKVRKHCSPSRHVLDNSNLDRFKKQHREGVAEWLRD